MRECCVELFDAIDDDGNSYVVKVMQEIHLFRSLVGGNHHYKGLRHMRTTGGEHVFYSESGALMLRSGIEERKLYRLRDLAAANPPPEYFEGDMPKPF